MWVYNSTKGTSLIDLKAISLTVITNPSRISYTRSHNLVSRPRFGGTKTYENSLRSFKKIDFSDFVQ